jgi:hypothetical protein
MPRSRKPSEPPGCVGAIPTPSATLTLNERKSHETCYSLSKPIALSQELQTKSCHSNPIAATAEPGVPPNARGSATERRMNAKHRVVLNTETETDTMRNVAFID